MIGSYVGQKMKDDEDRNDDHQVKKKVVEEFHGRIV
jgi:hypothetical protein